jgi:Icc-related predicted phosphoesterase
MKIGFCSDLHIDFYLRDAQVSKLTIDRKFGSYFREAESKHLIIAGDLGHYPDQSMLFLDYLKEIYGFEDILVVMGNHEGYLVNDKQKKSFPTGLHKIAYQQDLFSQNGIKVLDGTVYDIDGVTIGGANSFYDGTIYYRMATGYYQSYGGLKEYWKRYMNDSRMMLMDDFWQYAKNEKDKLRNLLGTVDIMVTHVKPVVSNQYFAEEFQGEISNAFYSFDFEEEIANDDIIYWVYGHTHTVEEFDFLGTTLVANPFGYPGESRGKVLKYLEVGL